MLRRHLSAICCGIVALLITASTGAAQSLCVSAGYAQPGRALAQYGTSGFDIAMSAQWQPATRPFGARLTGSFARLTGRFSAFAETPAVEVYGLTTEAVLTLPTNGVRPYLAAGPGLYGTDSYTAFRLGFRMAGGVEVPVGRLRIFGEVASVQYPHDRSSEGNRLRTLTFGFRR